MSKQTEEYITHVVDDLGAMIIAASGNSRSDEKFYPAAHPKVISVGGVMEDGFHWPGSTYGDQLELVAPAYRVFSTTVSTSSVQTESFTRSAFYLDGSRHMPVAGKLVDCGNGSKRCRRNPGGICLLCLESDDPSVLDDMLKTCRRSKAEGAIIYKGEGTDLNSWAQQTTLSAVVVQQSMGAFLKELEGEVVYIGDTHNDGKEFTYSQMTGTSMSVPHVAAAAALVWSHFGQESCTNHQIRYALARKAYHPDATKNRACDEVYGHGIVKAKDAYKYLSRKGCSNLEVPVSSGGCGTTSDEGR